MDLSAQFSDGTAHDTKAPAAESNNDDHETPAMDGERQCELPGCDAPLRTIHRQDVHYCSREHRWAARRLRQIQRYT